MTKQECAIVTAYTEISMLRGDDLKYLYRYLSEIIGRPVFSHEIPAVCEQFRDRIKADFIALCRNASDDIEPEVRHGRWIPTEYDSYADGAPVWDKWECSECDHEHSGEKDTLTAFCPDCGAKMYADGGTISRERFTEIMERIKRP